MLDQKLIRNNPQVVVDGLKKRGEEFPLEQLECLDEKRREYLFQVEQLKQQRNTASKKIGAMKREGKDTSSLIESMQGISSQISSFDEKIRECENSLSQLFLQLPNLPHPDVPLGHEEEDNVEIRKWGTIPTFSFTPKPHWDLGEDLHILDFERGGKVTGARFTFLKGAGAQMERALINFMLDLHIAEHGYQEIFPPFLANRESMTGTGQLPKFEEDLFKCQGLDYFLIPTAEVPVTNLYRQEIIPDQDLPIYHAAYSACFRYEAGAHGRDTRGIIRQHQFNKVELVKFVRPETSYEELESLVHCAEEVLKRLDLPYRVMNMCAGDLGFAAAKKYDLEVWFPSYEKYREISSCSNFEDFQARRSGIRYRPGPNQKARYVHTLNGSGVAIGRAFAAIMENYQQEDGSIVIPEVLRPYMGGKKKIENPPAP